MREISPETLSFEWTVAEDRIRLDQFVSRELPRISQTRLRRLIAEGGVLVNGQPSQKGAHLKPGAHVAVRIHAADRSSATPEPIPLGVLYEDADLIVVNKPRGLLTHPNHKEKSGTLTNGLAYHFWKTEGEAIRPGLVHRLDRQTSGAILVAKTARAHRTLSKHFRERWVRKVYLALVSGKVTAETGTIEAPIGCDAAQWPKWRILPEADGGRESETAYRVRERFAAHTLLELEPKTGRTHQLRIHCASIGHPIVGDDIYAPGVDPLASAHHLRAQLLHAWRLEFRHPATNQPILCEAPLPDDFQTVLAHLRAGEEEGR